MKLTAFYKPLGIILLTLMALFGCSTCSNEEGDKGSSEATSFPETSGASTESAGTATTPQTTTTPQSETSDTTAHADMSLCDPKQALAIQQLDNLSEFKTMATLCPHEDTKTILNAVKGGRQLASDSEFKIMKVLPHRVGSPVEVSWAIRFESDPNRLHIIEGEVTLLKKGRYIINPHKLDTHKLKTLDVDHYLFRDVLYGSQELSEVAYAEQATSDEKVIELETNSPNADKMPELDFPVPLVFTFPGQLSDVTYTKLKSDNPDSVTGLSPQLLRYNVTHEYGKFYPLVSPENSEAIFNWIVQSLLNKNPNHSIHFNWNNPYYKEARSWSEVLNLINLSRQGMLYIYQETNESNYYDQKYPDVNVIAYRYYRIQYRLIKSLAEDADGQGIIADVVGRWEPMRWVRPGHKPNDTKILTNYYDYYEFSQGKQKEEARREGKNKVYAVPPATSRYLTEPGFKNLLDRMASNIGMDLHKLSPVFLGFVRVPYEIIDGGSYTHQALFFRFVTHAKIGPRFHEPDPGAPVLSQKPEGAKIQITLPKVYLDYAKHTAVPIFIPSGGYVDIATVKSDLEKLGAVIEDRQVHGDHYLIFKMKPEAQIPEEGFRYFAHVYSVVEDTPENIIGAKQYYSQSMPIDHTKIPAPLTQLIRKSLTQELKTSEFLGQGARYFDSFPYTLNDEQVYKAYQSFYANESDPRGIVETFFDIQKADCDLFNGVFARILRSVAHLPSRMVAGYTSQYNPETGRGFIALGNPMHEWTEVLLRTQDDKHVWVPFDATSTWKTGEEKRTVENWLPSSEVLARLKGVQFTKPGDHTFYIRLEKGLVPLKVSVQNDPRDEKAPSLICSAGESTVCIPESATQDALIKYLESL